MDVPGPQRTALHEAADAVLIALFLLVLCLPVADAFLRLDPTEPPSEKRALAPKPELPTNTIRLMAYPAGFEAWFDDHFGFRSTLLRLHAELCLRVFGVAPSDRVVLGQDGWLFMAGDQLRTHRADRPYTQEDLEQWQRVLEARRDWLAGLGSHYLVVIVPNKSTIYPEHLPRSMRRIGRETRLDQLVRHLQQNSEVELLDLRAALLHAKDQEQVYFRTDSHWNGLGAFVGYREIVTALGLWLPGFEPYPVTKFEPQTLPFAAPDLAQMLGGAGGLFPEDRPILRPRFVVQAAKGDLRLPNGLWNQPRQDKSCTEIDDPSLPRCVFFCDSFAALLSGYLSEHFRRVVYFRPTLEVDPQSNFEPALVEQERPQVVISEFAERFLAEPPPILQPAGAHRPDAKNTK